MNVNWDKVAQLAEKSLYWTILLWFGVIASVAIPTMSTEELLTHLQTALWGVAMINAAVFVIVGAFLWYHEGHLMFSRRDKIEWCVAFAILLVTGYLWFTS